nr:RING/FYVE/PHD zinc finger superfamily protein [Tanacetum cinerariifolium]
MNIEWKCVRALRQGWLVRNRSFVRDAKIFPRAVIESVNKRTNSENEEIVTDVSSDRMDLSIGSLPKKLTQCRICHDEDEDTNMEAPCSCRGSLKYAHRKCVQRWCNEKGNTECEICLQPFKPGYTSSPPLFHCDGIPMNFRGNWEISQRDLHNLRFSTMVSAGHDETDIDDHITPSSRSLICCRVVAIIFMTLLVLRHTLPIIIDETGGYTLTLFTLIMLRCIGVLLPVYIMVRAYAVVQQRQQPQDLELCNKMRLRKGKDMRRVTMKSWTRLNRTNLDTSDHRMSLRLRVLGRCEMREVGLVNIQPCVVPRPKMMVECGLGKEGCE